eukprot:CAMPEP_0118636974 /NCGR_PEP_ID=MMETSP0785-20121206/2911_1 /TAXON_ID=91992 /ORGANISM="Bolidomonas pacifica, Strain CCMP 1866" /LENGTH=220 /DNA_ID=CAMNT_0006528141 /DNA_START=59 /DNA_END=718 /DNA_ORIENTATION=+
MLAADKLQLQSSLKQRATALKEKEFNLHHSNLMTVGTQAAVLATLDVTMFIEFQVPPWDDSDLTSDSFLLMYIPRFLKFIYYIAVLYAFCSNLKVVAHTTALAVLGTSLALRGPDGSMIVATEGLYSERSMIFKTFGQGLIATVVAALFACFLIMNWETAAIGAAMCLAAVKNIVRFYGRVHDKFDFDENTEAIDLSDMFSGPANIVGQTSDTFSRALSR